MSCDNCERAWREAYEHVKAIANQAGIVNSPQHEILQLRAKVKKLEEQLLAVRDAFDGARMTFEVELDIARSNEAFWKRNRGTGT